MMMLNVELDYSVFDEVMVTPVSDSNESQSWAPGVNRDFHRSFHSRVRTFFILRPF